MTPLQADDRTARRWRDRLADAAGILPIRSDGPGASPDTDREAPAAEAWA